VTWHIISLAVFAGLVMFAIDRWWSYRKRQLQQAELIHHEYWRKIKTATSREWECPACAVRFKTWDQVRTHSDPAWCACAAFREAQYGSPEPSQAPLLVEVTDSRATLDTFTEEPEEPEGGDWDA